MTAKKKENKTTKKKLTPKQKRFIDKYIELGNGTQAYIEAGYKASTPEVAKVEASKLLTKPYILEQISSKQEAMSKSTIATAQEVMEYFTRVMKGEEKDQFGLDAPLSERTKAAQELARRTVDIQNRLEGKADAEVKIILDWTGFKED